MLPRNTFRFFAMEIATAKGLSFGLRGLARNVRQRLWIACPFVGGWLATKCLIDIVWKDDPDVDVRLLTDVKNKGWLDPVTIREIAYCGKVKDLRGLHAKLFIIDDRALVTSANLTRMAFEQRREIGLFLTKSESAPVISIFEDWWRQAKQPPRGWISRLQGPASHHDRGEEPNSTHLKTLSALPKPPEDNRTVVSSKQVSSLLEKADLAFVCNTNRRWSARAERLMHERKFAAAWEDFKYPSHMRGVKRGNTIFMYAKRVGVVGIGRARAARKILPPGDPDRLRKGHRSEWRIPVQWLAWDSQRAMPFPGRIPNATFFEVSGDKYRRLRERAMRHFWRLAGMNSKRDLV